MANRFLGNYSLGKHDVTSLIGSTAVTWGLFLLMGGMPMLLLLVYYVLQGQITFADFLNDPNNIGAFGIPTLVLFLGAMGQFPVGFFGIWLSNKLISKRPLRSYLTAAPKFRWNRFFIGLVVWMLLMAAYGLVLYLKSPNTFKYSPDWETFFIFLPIALVLVPIQCAFEEVAVRGQLMQNIHGYFNGKTAPIASLVLSSLFFAILHSLNPEIKTYGFVVMMAQYFSIGLIFGIFAILEEGLELSIGLHVGNNLFAFLFVSYPGSVLETPSIYQQTEVYPWHDLLGLLAIGTVFFLLIYGRKPQRIKEIFASAKQEK